MLGPANWKEVCSGAAERSAGKDHRTPEPAMQNLADEFGVSWDTIQRDITILEQEYPLEITRGNGGGVAFPDGYHLTQRHLTAKQAQAVREAIKTAEPSVREALQSILTDFAWPT